MELTRKAFGDQVRDALQHLYDLAYTPPPELGLLLAPGEHLTYRDRTQAIRRILIGAIERLDPGPSVTIRARERRSYAILSACFARSMTAQAVMEELAISERQYWRDRKRAIEALVDELGHDFGPRARAAPPVSSPEDEREAVAREETRHMLSHAQIQDVSLAEVVRQAAQALQGISVPRGVHIETSGLPESLLVSGDRTVLRQICLNLLSYALHVTDGDSVCLRAHAYPDRVEVTVMTAVAPAAVEEASLGLQIVRQLLDAQGGSLHLETPCDGQWSATLVLSRNQTLSVLVIDDNAAAIKLFERYLAGTRFRVVPAVSGAAAAARDPAGSHHARRHDARAGRVGDPADPAGAAWVTGYAHHRVLHPRRAPTGTLSGSGRRSAQASQPGCPAADPEPLARSSRRWPPVASSKA